jgi:hypothetical protein
MTLQEWRKANPDIVVYPYAQNAVKWIYDGRMSMEQRAMLWQLSDYDVSSVANGIIWLREARKVSQ